LTAIEGGQAGSSALRVAAGRRAQAGRLNSSRALAERRGERLLLLADAVALGPLR
jgi:hypothetical protein